MSDSIESYQLLSRLRHNFPRKKEKESQDTMSKQYTQSRNRVTTAVAIAEAAIVKTSASRSTPQKGASAKDKPIRRHVPGNLKPGIREQELSEDQASFHAIVIAKTTRCSNSRALPGKVSSWRERVVRVTKPTDSNDGGSIEIFRLNRDKNGVGEVGELLFPLRLRHLDQMAPGCVDEQHKVKFMCVDTVTQKLVPEYIYGHILITLHFFEGECSQVNLCFNNSSQRDVWYEFFSSLVYSKEYAALVEAPRDIKLFVTIPECPRAAVNRFFTLFTSQKPQEEVKHKDIPVEERDDKDTQQLQFLAKRFDVILVHDESGAREHARIECPRPGLISVHGKRDFAVERDGVFQDPVNPDVFFLRPKRSDVVAKDLGVQLTHDGCLQVVVTSDAREFHQWLVLLFGCVMRKDRDDAAGLGERFKSTDSASVDSYDTNRASLLANSVFKSHGVRQRAESTCLVYVQYNSIGQQPSAETSFSLCFSVLYPLQRMWYFVQKPPSKRLLVELHFEDISSVSGYSKLYHMAGFTVHSESLGIELHVVPQDSASRNDWMRTIAECRLRIVKGKSREEWNAGSGKVAPFCCLCGEPPLRTLFCAATNIPHAEFIDELDSSSYLTLMHRRNVVTAPSTDDFIDACRASLQLGNEMNELLKRAPPPLSLF
jgi:hypothetical protein